MHNRWLARNADCGPQTWRPAVEFRLRFTRPCTKSRFVHLVFRAAAALLVLAATRPVAAAEAAPSLEAVRAFQATVLAATSRHLDALLEKPQTLGALKGKSAEGLTALAFYLTFEATQKEAYRAAALKLADGIVADMKATKFGVLFIKEKTRSTGEDVSGGGPPALGWYAAAVAYIYGREPGHAEGLRYVGDVLDRFPWNEQGWWSADIDVHTGVSKQPLTKPSPINKNAAVAMAAGLAATSLKTADPELAARLAAKAKLCLERQIGPAQEPDGFWHYGLTGRDPKGKDVFGYFMLTIVELLQWAALADEPAKPRFGGALMKAGGFARTVIAPMSDPNTGHASSPRMSDGTPKHYTTADEPKRAFQLGVALIGTGHFDEGVKIVEHALQHFPMGDRGQDGAHAAHATALIYRLLRDGPGRETGIASRP